MANLFESSNYRTTEPTLEEYGYPIIAGDLTTWKREDLTDYPATSYSLSYKARLENSGSTVISISASADGTNYLVSIAGATTGAYTVGLYHYDAYITKTSTSERIRVDYGRFEVIPDLSSSTADPRTHAKIVLDAIESVIEGRASQDQMSYSIAGRSLSRMSVDDLLTFRNRYKAEVINEERKLRVKEGLGHDGIIRARFGNGTFIKRPDSLFYY